MPHDNGFNKEEFSIYLPGISTPRYTFVKVNENTCLWGRHEHELSRYLYS